MSRQLEKVKFLQNQRVLLKFSDGSEIRVSESVYAEMNLKIGDSLTENSERQLLSLNNLSDCRKKALSLLSRRPHGTSELKKKLMITQKFSLAIVDKIISELNDLKYLDDAEFCRLFIEDSLLLKPNDGIGKIRQKLMVKGLAKSLIDENLRLLSPDTEDEIRLVRELAQRKWRSYPAQLDLMKKKGRLYRFLAGKGFSSPVVNRVVQEFRNNSGVK